MGPLQIGRPDESIRSREILGKQARSSGLQPPHVDVKQLQPTQRCMPILYSQFENIADVMRRGGLQPSRMDFKQLLPIQ